MTTPDHYPPVPPEDPAARAPIPVQPAWQPQQYPGYAAVPVAYPMLRTSGLCVAGMIVGILALLGFWIPFGDILMGLLAIGLSWAGMAQAAKPEFTGRGMGIAGLICGILAIIPAIVVMVFFFTAAATVTTCGAVC